MLNVTFCKASSVIRISVINLFMFHVRVRDKNILDSLQTERINDENGDVKGRLWKVYMVVKTIAVYNDCYKLQKQADI